MPVIRERKIPSEFLATWKEKGGCVRVGAEIWYVQPKRLQVGIIESVDEGNNTITVSAKGKSLVLSPEAKILFVEPHFKIPKDLRK